MRAEGSLSGGVAWMGCLLSFLLSFYASSSFSYIWCVDPAHDRLSSLRSVRWGMLMRDSSNRYSWCLWGLMGVSSKLIMLLPSELTILLMSTPPPHIDYSSSMPRSFSIKTMLFSRAYSGEQLFRLPLQKDSEEARESLSIALYFLSLLRRMR